MKTKIMGIINLTPDSFSDGGSYSSDYERINSDKIYTPDIDRVLYKVESMIEDGASIIDIGGESTRPGADYINAEEELSRVLPSIEAIRARFDILISLDTYKAKVAKEGARAGVDIINDIGMFKLDQDMARTVGELNKKYVLVHNNKNYVNLIDDMNESIGFALKNGIKKENLILDPGIGFNKSFEQNIEETKNVSKLCKLGLPVLLAVSNKSMIGNVLDLPSQDRLEGTLATTAFAVMQGVDMVRVHDVKANARVIKMMEALL